MLFALQFDPLVMVERFGVCLRVMVLAVINSRYVLPSADCFGCLLQFQSWTSHLLKGQRIACDVALVVVENLIWAILPRVECCRGGSISLCY